MDKGSKRSEVLADIMKQEMQRSPRKTDWESEAFQVKERFVTCGPLTFLVRDMASHSHLLNKL